MLEGLTGAPEHVLIWRVMQSPTTTMASSCSATCSTRQSLSGEPGQAWAQRRRSLGLAVRAATSGETGASRG